MLIRFGRKSWNWTYLRTAKRVHIYQQTTMANRYYHSSSVPHSIWSLLNCPLSSSSALVLIQFYVITFSLSTCFTYYIVANNHHLVITSNSAKLFHIKPRCIHHLIRNIIYVFVMQVSSLTSYNIIMSLVF